MHFFYEYVGFEHSLAPLSKINIKQIIIIINLDIFIYCFLIINKKTYQDIFQHNLTNFEGDINFYNLNKMLNFNK